METKTTYVEFKCALGCIRDIDVLKEEIVKEIPDVVSFFSSEPPRDDVDDYFLNEFIHLRAPYKLLSFNRLVKLIQKHHDIDFWEVKFITE